MREISLQDRQEKGVVGDMTEKETEKAYIHWLYQAAGMGSRTFLRDLEQVGTARAVYEMAARGVLADRLQNRYRKKGGKLQNAVKDYDVIGRYEEMTARGISMVTCREEGYPRRLAAIQDAPYVLYYAGSLPDEERHCVAVIGARSCTEYGKAMAKEFGAVLARAGILVISGMARGIDGIGQSAALEAGGYSMGVLGCGVDICYPSENRALYERLLAQGGVCSEYPPGTAPRAVLFPPRNRIISGLCDGVLVIEAKERSGTLITVDMALEQGREVYAVPGRVTDALSAGCNKLIRQGAGLVAAPEEFLEDLQAETAGNTGQFLSGRQLSFQIEGTQMEGTQKELLKLLDFQPSSMEALQEAYEDAYGRSIGIPKLCHTLVQLCVDGYAGQIGGSYYLKRRT